MKKIALVGLGFVGGSLYELFKPLNPVRYSLNEGSQEEVNKCDVAFISVPTPMNDDKTCDTSIIEEVFSWIKCPLLVIKSTVPPGTCKKLAEKYPDKKIVHNPEFLREQTAIKDLFEANRTVLGGNKEDCLEVARIYQKVYNHDMIYVYTDSTTSELVKYATNAYLATKVIFCNELYEICKAFGIDYDILKEIWLLEPRITRTHTIITEERGFGGHCFPKDLNALIEYTQKNHYNPMLLKQVWDSNCRLRSEFAGREYVQSEKQE